jgi:hypothetical protein
VPITCLINDQTPNFALQNLHVVVLSNAHSSCKKKKKREKRRYLLPCFTSRTRDRLAQGPIKLPTELNPISPATCFCPHRRPLSPPACSGHVLPNWFHPASPVSSLLSGFMHPVSTPACSTCSRLQAHVSFAAAQGIHQNNNNPLCQTPSQSCVSFATAAQGLLARLFYFYFFRPPR